MSKFGLRLTLGLLCAMTLTACATTHSTSTGSVACTVFKPVYYHLNKDSPTTVAQLRKNNAAWVALCGDPLKIPGMRPEDLLPNP